MIITHSTFKKVLLDLFGGYEIPNRLGVALSGGSDSMLLTYLLKEFRDLHKEDLKLHAITIDHKYRIGSEVEALGVGKILNKWNVDHSIEQLSYDMDPKLISNFEEVARAKRYEKLQSICDRKDISVLFLGHHLDDQLETFIQRLQGNSSIFGLAGTRKSTPLPTSKDLPPNELRKKVHLFRPLWGFEKSSILETCKDRNVEFFEDPTNIDANLTRRNYLRSLITDGLINKSDLIDSQVKCLQFANIIEEKAFNLYNLLKSQSLLIEKPQMGALSCKLAQNMFDGENLLVVSRFLYQIMHPVSTSKHYHWVYAKLERQLIPKIQDFLKSSKSKLTLTIMNCKFVIEKDTMVSINISRCNVARFELPAIRYTEEVVSTWSEWKLFDRRFWLRFKSPQHRMITVESYINSKHKILLHNSLQDIISRTHDTLPCVIQEGEVVAFPTLNLTVDPLQMEWSPKVNRFKYYKYCK